jgi:Flp pilus assembly protein TadG
MNRESMLRNEKGATAVTVAVSLVMLLSFGALTVDIGHSLVARNELQNVADAAALAGARELGLIYESLSPYEQYGYTLTSPAVVHNAVQTIASQNQAAGVAISIDAGDIQIGQWNDAAKTFTVTNTFPNAVRVTSRRDAAANGPISTFLANIMGVSSVSVNAFATAALTFISQTVPGELDVPFGISSEWFTNFGCNQPIRFHPTGDPVGCAGWHTFLESPPNANTLGNLIDGLSDGSYTSPATTSGATSLNFIGGSVASAFPELINLFNTKLPQGDPTVWEVFVPVYQDTSCANPSGPMMIVGYATANITNVQGPPVMQIDGIVTCNSVQGGAGGGANFGTSASIPGLVQ